MVSVGSGEVMVSTCYSPSYESRLTARESGGIPVSLPTSESHGLHVTSVTTLFCGQTWASARWLPPLWERYHWKKAGGGGLRCDSLYLTEVFP